MKILISVKDYHMVAHYRYRVEIHILNICDMNLIELNV